MGDPIKLRIRGEGGGEWDMDVPSGDHRRERFIEQIRNGTLTVLDDDGVAIDRFSVLAELGEDEPNAPAADDGDGLDGLTVKDLRARAAEKDIDLGDARKRDEIAAVIRAAEADLDPND